MTEPAGLSIIADAASLLSLLITGVVWWQVRSIKHSVIRNARVPDALKDLRKMSDELRETLKEWPKFERDVYGVLARVDSILTNVSPKLMGLERKKILEPQNLIKRKGAIVNGWGRKSDDVRHDTIWKIHDGLLGSN